MLSKLRRRSSAVGFAGAVAALAAAAMMIAPAAGHANASTSAGSHVAALTDPAGDVIDPGDRPAADYDIVGARAVERGSKLNFVVKVAGTPQVGDDHTVVGTGIQLEINTAGARPGGCHGDSRDPLGRAEYVVHTYGNPSLLDCNATGIPELEMVDVKRRPDSLVFIIDKAQIGNPVRYGWFASSGQTPDVTSDLAPDANAAGNPVYTLHGVQPQRRGGGARWRDCGDPPGTGAGAFNVYGLRIACPQALRIADYYPRSRGNMGRWRCASRRTGYETSRARCVRRTAQGPKAIRFQFGA